MTGLRSCRGENTAKVRLGFHGSSVVSLAILTVAFISLVHIGSCIDFFLGQV